MPIASIRRIAVAASVAALVAVPVTAATAPAAAAAAPAAPALSAAPAVPAAPALNAPYPPSGTLFVTPVTFAGGPIVFFATGFQRRELVTAELNGVPLGRFRANRLGIVAGAVRVPRGTPAATYPFTVTGTSQTLSANVTVRRRPGRSATTATTTATTTAATRSVPIDAAPVAARADAEAARQPACRATDATAGAAAAAALGLVGGGTYVALRRRRADHWR
jgi:hypothetical protein